MTISSKICYSLAHILFVEYHSSRYMNAIACACQILVLCEIFIFGPYV